ncbi:glycosyltransferase [Pseudopedobacter beijingensis]|uniref:Glycosyltransferase n=1 Tax=Pseudopedobacter beijingensis TaxID=1207056 RepID=A0ABW4IGX0_9SPHI
MFKNKKLDIKSDIKNSYILVLPSWYPSSVNQFNGDFNERFVVATSKFNKQIVLYVVINENIREKSVETQENDNVLTYMAYLPYSDSGIKRIYTYFKMYDFLLKEIFHKYGIPKIVHTYVFFPAGIVSYYLKYRYGVKTLLTENWTVFYKERLDYIKRQSFFKRILYKKILNSFDVVISVAYRLQSGLKDWISPNSKKIVVPNVVNTDFFNFEGICLKKTETFNFFHASTLGYQKNITGILNVFEKLLRNNVKITLTIAGTRNKEFEAVIHRSDLLKKHINYIGELTNKDVAMEMKKANAFLLFSRYENMPCVLLESLCCGLPVISSNAGGVSEIISSDNGIIVENENEQQLEEAILHMIDNYNNYDRVKISNEAISEFSYEVIGQKISKLYKELE